MRNFTFEFSLNEWTCGDGCCSGSEPEIWIYENGEEIYHLTYLLDIYGDEDAKERAREQIELHEGLTQSEYTLKEN